MTLRSSTFFSTHPRGGSTYVFVRTSNPRPTFHLDMTALERAIMQRHVCNTSSELPPALGTDLPWVLSPNGTVERRVVGEPEPTTSYGLLTPAPR